MGLAVKCYEGRHHVIHTNAELSMCSCWCHNTSEDLSISNGPDASSAQSESTTSATSGSWIPVVGLVLLFVVGIAALTGVLTYIQIKASAERQVAASEYRLQSTTTAPPRTSTTTAPPGTTALSEEDQAKLDRERLNAEIRAEIERNNAKLGLTDSSPRPQSGSGTSATTKPPVSINPAIEAGAHIVYCEIVNEYVYGWGMVRGEARLEAEWLVLDTARENGAEQRHLDELRGAIRYAKTLGDC